jgi:hypothetical protein
VKAFTVRCVLEGGRRTELQVLARSSCDALESAIATFGEQLRLCTVRPRLARVDRSSFWR